MLDAAEARGYRPGGMRNPASWRGNLEHLLPARKKLTRGHHPAMPVEDVPALMQALRERDVSTINQGFLTSVDEAIGQKLTRPTVADQVITLVHLEQAEVVRKGDFQAYIWSNTTGPDPLAAMKCYHSKTPQSACNYVLYNKGDSISLKPELSWNQELGWRYSEDNMALSATLFYISFKDRQISTTDVNGDYVVANVGEVKNRGLELEWSGKLPHDFNYYASYTYTEAEQQDDTGEQCCGKG